MIADVVGVVHNPSPTLSTRNRQQRSTYDASSAIPRKQKKPTDISSMPANTTSRSPSLGRYQNDSAESAPNGSTIGLNASAVTSGE